MQKALAETIAALFLLPGAVWAQAPSDAERYPWGPHMLGWGGGWYAMIFGPLFMILFLAVLVALVVILVRWLGGPWQRTHRTNRRPPARHSISSRSALRAAKSTRRSSRIADAFS